MKICQTDSGRKKKQWCFLEKIDEQKKNWLTICRSYGYVPHYNKQMPTVAQYDSSQNICPSCVGAAYKQGLIGITLLTSPTA